MEGKPIEQGMTLIEVMWLDAWSESADLTKEGLESLVSVPRKNVGYVTREDEEDIVLSSGITCWSKIGKDEDTFTDNLIIPKQSIIRVTLLEEKG